MKKALKIVSLIDIVFLVFLMLSSSLQGIASDVAYFAAFIIPFALGFYYSGIFRTEREEERGLAEPLDSYFHFDKKKIVDLLPLIFPAVAIVFVLAALTSILLTALNFSNPQPENKGFFVMLIIHALSPAVLEEMLFRYIPMKLLAPYSKRWCVIISSFFFALIHANLFQMPYAFAAGVIFMCVNLAFDSIWPSLILHFINNAASVVWMKYCTSNTSMLIFISILLSLAVLSLVFIVLLRNRYKSYLRSAFEKGRVELDAKAPIALMAISLYIAVSALFM